MGTFDLPNDELARTRDQWDEGTEWLSIVMLSEAPDFSRSAVDFVARERASAHLAPGAKFYAFEGKHLVAVVTIESASQSRLR